MGSAQQANARTVVPEVGRSSRDIDAMKGFFIFCVVLGHNPLVSLPHLSRVLYAFHVIGFLLMPVLFRTRAFSPAFFLDRVVRYLVPYVAFVVPVAVLFLVSSSSPDGFATWLKNLGIAIPIGSTYTLKMACGFQLYWFLPALLTLTVMRSAYASLTARWKTVVVIVAAVAHVSIGALPSSVRHYAPFGVLSASYAFLLTVIVEALWHRSRLRQRYAIGAVTLVVWLACEAVIVLERSFFNIGTVTLCALDEMPLLVTHDVLAVSAFLTVAVLSPFLAAVPGLSLLGRHSLVVYLCHSVIFQGVRLALCKPGLLGAQPVERLISAAVGLAITLTLATLLSVAIQRTGSLRTWILPRGLSQWPPTRRLGIRERPA